MDETLELNSLNETRAKLNIHDVRICWQLTTKHAVINYLFNLLYQMAAKTLKTVNKQLSDMGKEMNKIAETSSVTPLTQKFEQVENRKIEIEAKLLERVCKNT